MSDYKDTGAIPQGLIEQSRAKPVDPGKLQMLGKQAAALHSDQGTNLSDAVVSVIGKEELGPEHTRRVCEFANQEAFQREWEKGGSVRNVEFEGGPADPAVVLQDMHDGARSDAVRVSDYDSPPVKIARADRRVEEEIFGKYAQPMSFQEPSLVPEVHRMKQTLEGAQGHIHGNISALEISKEAVAQDLGDEVCNSILSGNSLHKIAAAWSHLGTDQGLFKEALDVALSRMKTRGVALNDAMEKVASAEPVGNIPNPKHPLVEKFQAFTKISSTLRTLKTAQGILGEQLNPLDTFLREHHG